MNYAPLTGAKLLKHINVGASPYAIICRPYGTCPYAMLCRPYGACQMRCFYRTTIFLFVSAVSVLVLLGMYRRGGCLDFWCKSLFAVSVEIDVPEVLFALPACTRRPSDGKIMSFRPMIDALSRADSGRTEGRCGTNGASIAYLLS